MLSCKQQLARLSIMRRHLSFGSFSLLLLTSGLCAQKQQSAKREKDRPAFVKALTFESFGYDLSPMEPGYESRAPALSAGPFTTRGLECPYCNPVPLMSRSRPTLQPFGAAAVYRPFGGRVELFTRFSGMEAWLPDGLMRLRGSTYNDSWLLQAEAGASVALDEKKHFWLGVTGRYLQQAGALRGPRSHWNTFGGNAMFRFGR